MPVRLFLAAMLSCCAVGASGNSVSSQILASAGETVVLPCRINVSDEVPAADVEWSKEGLDPNIAFLYRDGCETYEMKNPVFQYRTNLFISQIKTGNISLRISDLQLSDSGKYMCKTLQRPPRVVVTVELVVGAASEPKLSVVPSSDGGVTLQCEANCWFPEPEVEFLDEQGNNISAEKPKRGPEARGCFSVTRRVTVQAANNRVTCRVHQPHQMNQTRVTDIYIPVDCMRSCTPTTIIAVVVTAILCALIAVLFIKCGNSVWAGKALVSSDQSTACRNAEAYTERNQADDNGDDTTEHLRKIEELKCSPHEKEELNRQHTKELDDLRSKQSPVACQHGQPTFDNSPSKSSPDVSKPVNLPSHRFPQDNNPKPVASSGSNCLKYGNLPQNKDSKPGVSIEIPAPGPLTQSSSHNHSSPALSTGNGAVSPSSSSEERPVVRSMSLSEPRRNCAKPQRRSTISTNNPFSVLANLPEDSEPLLQ